ncbi:peptidoglycan-binding protein [Geodermatophilus sp. SYSU D00965]
MSWRVARSLETFRAQLDAACPSRDKRSDGSIGDAAHAARTSDHNPWYGPGIVTARDFTHDPAGGVDIGVVTDQLVQTRDPRIKYVIANGLILDSRPGNQPWTWVPYRGPNPHRHHFHLSVVASPLCDDPAPWALPMFAGVDLGSDQVNGDLLRSGRRGPAVLGLQRRLNRDHPEFARLREDGVFGPATEAAVREFQRRSGLTVDGIAGPATMRALGLVPV